MIKVGDHLPQATLYEFIDTAREGCSLGPNAFAVDTLSANKKIVIFGLPGAYTPTCSAQHLPGYVAHVDAFKNKGVDEIWCISVNDAFVMGAWARDTQANGKVRLFGDGNAELTKKLGLEFDLTKHGMGVRSQRYAMIVENGIVQSLFVEAPGKFDVSNAETVLQKI